MYCFRKLPAFRDISIQQASNHQNSPENNLTVQAEDSSFGKENDTSTTNQSKQHRHR